MFSRLHDCSCTNSKQCIVPISQSYENCWQALSFYDFLNILTHLRRRFCIVVGVTSAVFLQFSCHHFSKKTVIYEMAVKVALLLAHR